MSDAPERFDPETLAGLPPELAMARLPAGRHGLPRSFVAHNQRLRLIAAMLRVLPRHGYPAITIGHITQEAGVSRAAFYQQFAGKEECFLATYDVAAAGSAGRSSGLSRPRPSGLRASVPAPRRHCACSAPTRSWRT